MTSVRSCPGCLARAARLRGSVNGFALVRCDRCATLFTATLPRSPFEAADYAGRQAVHLEVPRFVEHRLGEIAAAFDGYRRLNRWLDVGCGAGALMRAASRQGWNAVGTEVSPAAAERIRAAGLEAHLGELEKLDLEAATFDVVSAIEVVEHLEDPVRTLEEARRLLRPGGALYLTTPHGRGLSARVLGSGWSVVAPPEHLQLFSVGGIRALLARAGFTGAVVRTEALNPHELLRALRRGDGATTAGERKETGRRLNEALSRHRGGYAVKLLANRALDLLRLGDTLKVTAERQG